MNNNNKIGLGLSGGGYRAAAFHLGTFRTLHELGLLDRIDVLSTISGGSIIGAYYLMRKNELKENFKYDSFETEAIKLLQKDVILRFVFGSRVTLFLSIIVISSLLVGFYLCSWQYLLMSLFIQLLILVFFQHRLFSTTEIIAKIYDDIFFQGKELNFLTHENTKITINATNLSTARLWSFRHDAMGDSSYEYNQGIYYDVMDFRLSLAVACSTAFPLLFSPFKIPNRFLRRNASGTFELPTPLPQLMDGGIYDNQGMHKLGKSLNQDFKCQVVICSDGSSPLTKVYSGFNIISVMNRVVTVMMTRIKNMQFIDTVIERNDNAIKEIAYYGLDWEYEKCWQGFLKVLKNEANSHPKRFGKVGDDCYDWNDNFIVNGELIQEEEIVLQKLRVSLGLDKCLLSPEEIKRIANIKTNLTALSKEDINLLIRHGRALSTIQIKLYCSSAF